MKRLVPSASIADSLDWFVEDIANHKTQVRRPISWIREVREAFGISAVELGEKLDISQPAVSKLERSETSGTISLGKLQEVADTMGCDVVYAFVPRKGTFVKTSNANQKKLEKAQRDHLARPRF